jgi:hypothetical protein
MPFLYDADAVAPHSYGMPLRHRVSNAAASCTPRNLVHPAEVRRRFEHRKFSTFSGTNRRTIGGTPY